MKKRSGKIVETKNGDIGKTYNDEPYINGKIRVYIGSSNLLCDPDSLKLKGFFD